MAKNPLIFKKVHRNKFSAPGNQSAGIFDDYAVRKNVATREGSIEKVPVNDSDISNKKYVDDEISSIDLTPYVEKAGDTMTGTLSGSNIAMTDGTIAGMNIDNDGTKTTFLGTAGDYNRIGDAGTTGASLNSEDDLLVTGEFEVLSGIFRSGGSDDSIAIGNGATASGSNDPIAIGHDATASGDWKPLAIGKGATASSNDSIALGGDSNVSGGGGVAIGSTSSVVGSSVVIGYGSHGHWGGVAIGRTAMCTGGDSLALGNNALASGTRAVSLGFQTTASATDSITLGFGTDGSNKLTNSIANSLMLGSGTTPKFLFKLDTGNLGIGTTTPSGKLHISGGNIYIQNTTAPATPTNAGALFVSGGELWYIGSSGTQTQLGVA